ncbi:MAG: rod shape-determining protein MreD [Gammaproteobacteria bacterium]
MNLLNREPYGSTAKHPGGDWLIILFSFIVALALAIIPLPSWALVYRPEWVAVVLIYWCLTEPRRVGIGMAWGAGLLLDVLTDSLLGQHALGLAVVAFLVLKLNRRMRTAMIWQQALTVLFLVAVEQMLVLWIKGVAGHPPWSLSYFVPSLTSMLAWPLVYFLLCSLLRSSAAGSK